jgi:DNA-binding IclR family transcriptional regulator
MSILKSLARLGGSASLTAIATDVQENTAKVHRYLMSLAQEGLVAQNPATQHYQLGRESIAIGLAALRQCDPVRMGEGALARLREALKLTCFIAVMGNVGPTVLRIEEPSLPVTVNIRPGSVLPLLWSASGQVFLAFSMDAALQLQAQAELASATPAQCAWLGAQDPVAQLCQRVRSQGCAVVHDTLVPGISAVSAPIFDAPHSRRWAQAAGSTHDPRATSVPASGRKPLKSARHWASFRPKPDASRRWKDRQWSSSGRSFGLIYTHCVK